MTAAVFPSLLRQDPRYFQRGRGGFLRRFVYAGSRIFVARGDYKGTQFNYSEFAGNATAAALSNLYEPASTRTLLNGLRTWETLIAIDAFGFEDSKNFGPTSVANSPTSASPFRLMSSRTQTGPPTHAGLACVGFVVASFANGGEVRFRDSGGVRRTAPRTPEDLLLLLWLPAPRFHERLSEYDSLTGSFAGGLAARQSCGCYAPDFKVLPRSNGQVSKSGAFGDWNWQKATFRHDFAGVGGKRRT